MQESQSSTFMIETAEYDRPPSSLFSNTGSAPSYSSLPRPEEETVQYTRRSNGLNPPPTDGIYTKNWESLTLILHDQVPGVERPVYGRHNLVAGELELKRPENVLAVVIKLEGKVTVASSGIGAEVVPTVLEEKTLWDKSATTSTEKCPGILGFSFRLPWCFSQDGRPWTLPPSFEPEFMHTMFVRSTYSLTIVLTRMVKYLVSWENVKTYGIRIDYIPRSRASQALPQFDSIWSIKSSPNEWTQHVSTVEGPGQRPIECHFLVPAKYSHALSDSIPFHIQLSSSLDTLKELVSPSDVRPRQVGKTKGPRGVCAMRVYIARQIIVEIHGKTSFQTLNIGSGTIRAVPPADFEGETGRRKYPCLDWEGEVKCLEKIKTGGFDIGSLHVRVRAVICRLSCVEELTSAGFCCACSQYRPDECAADCTPSEVCDECMVGGGYVASRRLLKYMYREYQEGRRRCSDRNAEEGQKTGYKSQRRKGHPGEWMPLAQRRIKPLLAAPPARICEPISEEPLPTEVAPGLRTEHLKRHHRPRAPLFRNLSAPQLTMSSSLMPRSDSYNARVRGASHIDFKTATTGVAAKAMRNELSGIVSTISDPPSRKAFDTEMQSFFYLFTRYLAERAKAVDLDWDCIKSPADDKIVPYAQLPKPKDVSNLNKLAVLKVNGGLGTSMGMTGAKSALEVKDDMTFLDLTVRQIEHLNTSSRVDVPLILMTSFNTHEDTLRIIKKYANQQLRITTFNQSRYPRIYKESLLPCPQRADDDKKHWYPPGHGDLYNALLHSGVLDQLLSEGKEYLFVSNSDNLGAVVDESILQHMIDTQAEFIMEVTDKTKADIKGGTLIDYEGSIRLLEIAQVPSEHVEDFKSVRKFKIFNTNNLWINLKALKRIMEVEGMELDIIINPKTTDDGHAVIQLETAAGAAIKHFKNAHGINVPRKRFLPVKSCSDLLLIKSDIYSLSHGQLVINENRMFETTPVIKLGDHFKKIQQFQRRFKKIPRIIELDHLTVTGDVYFGRNVTLRGTVIIVANEGQRIDIPDGCILENRLLSGNLSMIEL